MTYISRDVFAREELHSERDYQLHGHTCDWCGQVRSTPKTSRPYLYVYRVESDGGRHSKIKGRFCSTGCMRAYHS